MPLATRLKHRWSFSFTYMTGLPFGLWMKLLAENRFRIDPAYLHRAAFITLTSLYNSAAGGIERLRFARAIERSEITEPPVFILGHWRSGTTLLHDLLARDDTRFNFPNTYQVVNPHTFLTTERLISRAFAWMVPGKRPMDNMALDFHSPQEDEFGPLLMALKSPYLGLCFPQNERHYEKYLSFRESGTAEVAVWQQAMLAFCRKLSINDKRALLLKSPPHTARIRTILEIFPDARFVHIHRDPYRVFVSQRHFIDTMGWYTYLQRPDPAHFDEAILSRYVRLYDAFFEDLALIPKGNFCELRFEDLERDPVGQIGHVYDALSLGDFEPARPKVEAYAATLKDYRKNTFNDLEEETRAQVHARWRRSFEKWGYPA